MAYPATQPRSVFTERDKQTSVLFERLFSARDDSERERASSSRSSPSTSTCARRWPVATTARPPAVVREELEQELGATPSEDDLAAAVGASVDELREVARATTAFRQLSIDCSPVDDDRPSLAAVLSRPDGELERAEDRGPRTEDRACLAGVLTELDDDKRELLLMRYVDGLTQREIGELRGVSQRHVSRCLRRVVAPRASRR